MTRPLPPLDVGPRSELVRERLESLGLDGLLITNLTNVRWLTGFTGSNAAVLVTIDRLVVFTDTRYRDQAPAEMVAAGLDADVVIGTDVVEVVASLTQPGQTLGLEADDVSWGLQQRLASATAPELVATSRELLTLRSRKDPGELMRIRAAAAIADRSLAEVAPILSEGATEREVALALDDSMRRAGAQGPAYETIVASGPRAALPHARPTDRVIGPGDLVIIDVGAAVDGYRSDMTRSFVVGDPTAEQKRMLDVVLEAQESGKTLVCAGVSAREVDTACRSVITDAGWGEEFSHGTGHGVGLDIHEHPRLSSRTDDVLESGMVVTIEPGVYLPDRGGVRWEDLLVVTADGFEVLTESPKKPVVA
ncbi:MAG: M24 family metallopeptidase [Acidimicrobiales bacterium]